MNQTQTVTLAAAYDFALDAFKAAREAQPGRRILAITDPNASPLARRLGADVRFFIGIGFPGFNSPANNRYGYATVQAAWAATRRYERKGLVRRDA